MLPPRSSLPLVRRVGFRAAAFCIAAALSSSSLPLRAADPALGGFTLDTVVVESERDSVVQEPFLPEVAGTQIYAGKKTSVIDLDALPAITNNNYRQALAKTPGLYLSEESTPLVSIGYRGLNPSRAQFTQVLRDGIPIHADQFGYPEAYYTPPLDTVDRIEFLRGGASLLYGPQPGGALNYVTNRPNKDRAFGFGSGHTFGSNQYYSTFSYVDGTSGRVGYYGYFNHRQTEGFRQSNSDVRLNAGLVKLVLDGQSDSRWILTVDGYEEEHGEPGGLKLSDMRSNRRFTSRPNDRFKLERYAISLQWERDFSEDTKMVTSVWGTSYSRWSRRQEVSKAMADQQKIGNFGNLPDRNTFLTEDQKFFTVGLEQRWRRDYEAFWGGKNTLTAGFQWYRTVSPMKNFSTEGKQGGTAGINKDSDREVTYLPVFVENRFSWGRFSLTPGFRFENAWQGARENANKEKRKNNLPLLDASDRVLVPLFGVGATYEFAPKQEIYANVSQSYRPKIWTQAVPTGPNNVMPNALDESSAWQYEVGIKGRPQKWLYWDVSGFLLDFDNQIGQVGNSYQNVGRAQHLGLEIAGEIDFFGWFDQLQSRGIRSKQEGGRLSDFGSLSLYVNTTFLDAEFVSGSQSGKTPMYAPRYLVRSGLVYRTPQERFKVAFTSSFVGKAFGDDANSAGWRVPSYAVWDLTGEAKLYKEFLSINCGVNNLFDKNYFSRVTSTGIDPAQGRNFYGGVSLKF